VSLPSKPGILLLRQNAKIQKTNNERKKKLRDIIPFHRNELYRTDLRNSNKTFGERDKNQKNTRGKKKKEKKTPSSEVHPNISHQAIIAAACRPNISTIKGC